MKKNRESIRRNIGEFLRKARINKSLTGYELGHLMHISQQQVSRYERGKSSINIETLDIMLEALGKNWEDLLSVMTNYSADVTENKESERN